MLHKILLTLVLIPVLGLVMYFFLTHLITLFFNIAEALQ